MAVGADDQVAGHHDTLLRQQGVLHPHVAAFIEMDQVLFPGELPHGLHLDGRGDVLVGGEVVAYQHHPLAVKDLFGPDVAKGLDGQGRSDVVTQGDVNLGQDQFPGGYICLPAWAARIFCVMVCGLDILSFQFLVSSFDLLVFR